MDSKMSHSVKGIARFAWCDVIFFYRQVHAQVDIFNKPVKMKWDELAPLPIRRSTHSAALQFMLGEDMKKKVMQIQKKATVRYLQY